MPFSTIKYLLVFENEDGEYLRTEFSSRPTQQFIKDELGEGVYELRKVDGTLIKIFTVFRNQKGNLSITYEAPLDLRTVSTLNLHRTLKALRTAAKYWTLKEKDVRTVETEIARRNDLLGGV